LIDYFIGKDYEAFRESLGAANQQSSTAFTTPTHKESPAPGPSRFVKITARKSTTPKPGLKRDRSDTTGENDEVPEKRVRDSKGTHDHGHLADREDLCSDGVSTSGEEDDPLAIGAQGDNGKKILSRSKKCYTLLLMLRIILHL